MAHPAVHATKPDTLRHPWLLVLACAAGLTLSIGPIFVFTFPTFIAPWAREFGWSRGALSSLYTASGVALIVMTFILGPVIQRIGPKRTIVFSTVAFAASLVGLALSPPQYWIFLLCSAAIGAAGAGTNTFAYLALLPQWFTNRLGLIFGLAMTGIGIGQLAMPILAQHMTELAGWRASYLVLAAIVLALSTPFAITFLKENPRYSDKRAEENGDVRGFTLKQAVRTPTFWLLWIGLFLLSAVLGATFIHLAPLLIDRGASEAAAASAVASTGVATLIFRLIGGYLIDRAGPYPIGACAFVAAALAQLILLPQAGMSLALFAPLLVGLVTGIEGDVLPYVSRHFFGMRDYGLIYSRMFLSMMSGPLVGAAAAGFLFDYSGSYSMGLWVFMATALIALLLFWLSAQVWKHQEVNMPLTA